MKKDLTKIFITEIYKKPPVENYPTNKSIYNRLYENWSIDLAEMIDYKTSNNKGFRYIFVELDNFNKYLWALRLKKYSQTITNEFSNILTTSERKPLKIESDRETEFYNGILQNFLKSRNIRHYSRFTDKSPSIVERVIKTLRNLMKKPVVLAGNADWLFELPLNTKKQHKSRPNKKNETN